MQNPEEPNAEQEPNAEHHVAKILVEVLILRSICGPLKRKLMAFSCHIQLSRVPPRCVMLWRSPEMNFTRLPRVAKLFCIGSPLNRSRGVTYCTRLPHQIQFFTGQEQQQQQQGADWVQTRHWNHRDRQWWVDFMPWGGPLTTLNLLNKFVFFKSSPNIAVFLWPYLCLPCPCSIRCFMPK